MVDLADHDVRAAVAARLGAPLAGRPVILGPGMVTGFARPVRWLGALGCPVLVLATARGAGAVPDHTSLLDLHHRGVPGPGPDGP